jgi:hypothetical protein
MADFTYDVVEKLGVLSENPKGWTKELNLISWNGREPKYDVREWSPEHNQMSKGITFTNEEITALKDLLNAIKQPE